MSSRCTPGPASALDAGAGALALLAAAADDSAQRLLRVARQALATQDAWVSVLHDGKVVRCCSVGPGDLDDHLVSALCRHTLQSGSRCWIADAEHAPLAADLHAPSGQGVRGFLAGVVLHAPGGERIGALCVADPTPRALDSTGESLLADLAACLDDSFRRRAETELTALLDRERRRLAQIIDATRVGTWEWNVHTGETRLGEHWGATLDHAVDTDAPQTYETWSSLVHPDDLPEATSRLAACLRGDTGQYTCEYRMRHREGGWRWVLDCGRVVARDAEGRPEWMAGTHSDINDRKLLELALAAQAEFLREIVETSPSALVVCDAEGGVHFRNPAARRLLDQLEGGSTAHRQRGLPDFLGADGTPLDPAAQPIAQVCARRERLSAGRLALRDAGGALRPLQVDTAPLGAAADAKVLLSLLDVSEQARREQQLEWEQRRFRSLVDSTQGIVWEAEPKTGNFRFVSQQAERLLGYPAEQWLAPGFWAEHLHAEDRESTVAYCLAETAAGRDHTFDYRMLARDGRVVWLRDFVTLATDAGGAPVLRGLMVDVTAEYLADAALQEARTTLRLALGAGGIGTWQVDTASGAQTWDAQMWRLFGIDDGSSAEARELALASLDLPALLPASAASRPAADSGRVEEMTRAIRRADNGEMRQLRVAACLVKDPAGALRLVGTAWDCTSYAERERTLRERQEALQQLVEAQTLSAVQARHRAERAASLQGEFLANVSHELRTPLHAILGFLGLAIDELADGSELARPVLQQRIGKAQAAASRLLGLVDELLDLAKLESGHNTLSLAPASLEAILDTVIDELQPLHAARGIRVQRNAAGRPLPVLVDLQRVGQVFRNVLANASRFSPERGLITVSLAAASAAGEDWVDVLILDQGPGIPEGEHEQIFDKFVQSSRSVQGRAGGTGLGLPIAREIMRAHGGDIHAGNGEHGGALFRIRFPMAGVRDIEAMR